MAWTILTNRTEGHNKFWSHDEEGNVHWGRIGTRGQSGRYDMSNVMHKEMQKLSNGYVLITRNGSTPFPGSEQGDRIEAVRETLRQTRTVTPQSFSRIVRNTRQRVHQSESNISLDTQDVENLRTGGHNRSTTNSEGMRVPEFDRNHNVPNVDTYKTDAAGYIKYRTGYKRQSFDNYSSTLKVMKVSELVNSNLVGVDNPFFKKAKEYFNRIPGDSQYNKPENFEQLRENHRPTYAVLYSVERNNIECVAIFGVNRSLKYCDFLSLKKNTPYYRTILKYIIKSISRFVDVDGKINFKIKSPSIRKEIKEIADYYISTTGDNIVYNVRDLQTGISEDEVKPKRWIE